MTTDLETGKLQLKKKKYPGFKKNLHEYFSEFSGSTSLHGVRYLGEKTRNIFERLCWLIIISVSLYLCSTLIITTYKKWIAAPVIVSFAKTSTPVWKIPFPAITVCPETKTLQRIYNFTNEYHRLREHPENMTKEEINTFDKVSLVCNNNLHKTDEKTIEYDTINYLAEVAPQFKDVLWQCKWLNQNQSCADLLTPILTEEGLCFTFNMLDRDELFTDVVFHSNNYSQHGIESMNWTLETGFPDYLGADTFPRRAVSAGVQGCFSLLMTLYEQDLDYICRGPVQGYKILLHNPTETPRVSQHYFRAPLNQEVIVIIMPEMMTTSESLKSYAVHNRQCYFSYEKQLMYYKIYTQRNCEVECITNMTLLRCGCVAFHMPRNETTSICGPGSIECMKKAENEMVATEVNLDIETRCDCLPACTSLDYDAETSQADFNWPKVFDAYSVNYSEFPGVTMTRVYFFFKEQQFITSERNELYGITDFLANCGGLLGLFIGFSILSIVEILYFLTLRLLCNIKRYGYHFWSGSQELINSDAYEHKN